MEAAIVSTILGKLKTIAIDHAKEEIKMLMGVDREVEKLENNLEAIGYVLEDAEEKQYVDEHVKYWLDRFKEVAYDMEDVLDDWKTALETDFEVETGRGCCEWMVRPFISYFSFGAQVARRRDIATRIKGINEKLDQITKDKEKLKLLDSETKQPRRSESTSFADVSKLVGRDEVKKAIIGRLLGGTSEEESCNNIPTITILGMGGIGKTALAQLIYNDPRIQTHFNKTTIWVSVSEPLDQNQIARAILGGLDPNSVNYQNPTALLQDLLKEICEKITGKKFFLVLDDVWTDRYRDWEPLKTTFQYGMSGSWILVTTRKESVAWQMDLPHVFPLDLLPDEMCWLILAQKAFIGRNRDRREYLEDIGRKIAKKYCKGLPLAAKALGGVLQDKLQREEWQNVLNSAKLKSNFAQEYIFTPSLLSYYDLPSTIRQCLLYCAIFPKNYRIGKDELIQHWMAQGYLNSDDNLGRELEGEEYFKCLAARSFFQDFGEDDFGNVCYCNMHETVHDFVQFLARSELVVEEDVEGLTLNLSSKKARHLRLVVAYESRFPMSICGTEKLRSLVADSHGSYGTTDQALRNLFSQSKRLRLLKFAKLSVDAKGIPGEIRNLIHLRYLSLSYCHGIKNLPEAVCDLPNLQSLNLEQCPDLKKLPVGIGRLINLRYLYIVNCPSLTYCPKGISKLTSLMRLGGIIMRADRNDDDEFSVGDLENLDLLGGILDVELIGDAIDGDEAKRAKLHNKKHLKGIHININSWRLKEEEEDVPQALNLPPNVPVVLTDVTSIREQIRMTIQEKIRVALLVQKAALQHIDSSIRQSLEEE